MHKIFKAPITKESFKLALNECGKAAWIFNSFDNFIIAVDMNLNNEFTFNVDQKLDDRDEFYDDGNNMDIWHVYLSQPEHIKSLWDETLGFDITRYAGDAIEDGNALGKLSRDYYVIKNAQEEDKQIGNFEESNFKDALFKTNDALKEQEKYSYLFEPAFAYDDYNLKTRCDILKLNGNNHVDIIEFKATTNVKSEHFFDLVYQVYVLRKNGLIVDNIYIGHLNKNYILGEELKFNSLKEAYENLKNSFPLISFEEVKTTLEQLKQHKGTQQEADIDIAQLIEIDPRTFGTIKDRVTLNQELINFESQFDLDFLFTKLTNLMALNIEEIKKEFDKSLCDIPLNKSRGKNQQWNYKVLNNAKEELNTCFHVMPYFDKNLPSIWDFGGTNKGLKSYWIRNAQSPYLNDEQNAYAKITWTDKLSDKQLTILNAGQNYDAYETNPFLILNKNHMDLIENELAKYDTKNHPIYMYDFETVKWAIPRFVGQTSYMQTPFQYSIDIIIDDKYDYNRPETMIHFDHISSNDKDPRIDFIHRFIFDMFAAQGPGIYVAYNDSFEKGVILKLAYHFPEYKIPLMYIYQNTIDLMDFFYGNEKQNRPWFMIYHPNFNGSYSIKKTQPALDPAFSYKDLNVNNGLKASEIYRQYQEKSPIVIQLWEDKIKEDMLKYCNRDTLAMVVILRRIADIFKEYKGKDDE